MLPIARFRRCESAAKLVRNWSKRSRLADSGKGYSDPIRLPGMTIEGGREKAVRSGLRRAISARRMRERPGAKKAAQMAAFSGTTPGANGAEFECPVVLPR